jgi:hypothetical protein
MAGFGQSLQPPVIDSVSVEPGSGNVYIVWHDNNVPSVHYFVISRINYATDPRHPTSVDIDTVLHNQGNTYIDKGSDASNSYQAYRVYNDGSDFSVMHRTVYLRSRFDSCNAAINLSWSEYIGWDSPITYEIYQHDSYTLLGTTTDTVFVIENVSTERVYPIFVRAKSGEKTSTSNMVFVDTDRPDIPTYIHASGLRFNDGALELEFVIDPGSQLKEYRLLRSKGAGMSNPQELKIFNNPGSRLSFTDENAGTYEKYFYQVEALDGCGKVVFISDTAHNILVRPIQNNERIDLEFTNGDIWPSGKVHYEIFRTGTTDPFENIGRSNNLEYADNLEGLFGQGYKNELCYFVRAVEEDNGYYNQSDFQCIVLDPIVFVPGSFYPGQAANNYFLPVFSFIPSNYEITIINKNGQVFFQSNNPSEPWYGNGAPMGSYVFTITYSSASGKKGAKSGTVNLIKGN